MAEKKEEITAKQDTPKEPEKEVQPEAVSLTKEEIEQLRSEVSKMEQNWKDAQRVISRKDEEIQRLTDDHELWKAMIGYVSEQRGISEEQAEQAIQQRKPNLAQQFDIKQRQLEQKRRAEKSNDYRRQVEALGLKAGDDDYSIIYGLVATGQYDKADKRIESIKAKSQETSKKEEPKETEEEIIERKVRERLEAQGVLTPENAEPSAAGGTVTISREALKKMPVKERHELLRTKDVIIKD